MPSQQDVEQSWLNSEKEWKNHKLQIQHSKGIK